MSDYYLEDRSRLQGQPKRTIGEYVRSNGILVPRIFDSLADAKSAGVPILARSEHEQEYDGVSGLLASIPLDLDEEYKSFIKKSVDESISDYCKLTKVAPNEFSAGVSYSYWEMVEGVNRTVVADSAVPNRHHVMSYVYNEKGQSVLNYTIFNNGCIEKSFAKELTPELKEGLPQLVALYESVRNLERFDRGHCPIMEFQTAQDSTYFLQYHRTREFTPTTFNLKREGNALFVRGSTPPEGFNVKCTVVYAGDRDGSYELHPEEGSCTSGGGNEFTELMVRQRKVHIYPSKLLDFTMRKVAAQHTTRSQFFKPTVSILMDDSVYITNDEYKELFYRAKETRKDQTIDLFVQSDGTNAYVERIR